MKTAVAILFILFVPCIGLPQTTKKIPVAVDRISNDQVGQSLYFALKEAIRASQSFTYVDHDDGPISPRIVVYLVSADDSVSEAKGESSSIALSIVYDSITSPVRGAYINTTIMQCGRNKIDVCAKGTLEYIDRAVESLRKHFPQLWKTL